MSPNSGSNIPAYTSGYVAMGVWTSVSLTKFFRNTSQHVTHTIQINKIYTSAHVTPIIYNSGRIEFFAHNHRLGQECLQSSIIKFQRRDKHYVVGVRGPTIVYTSLHYYEIIVILATDTQLLTINALPRTTTSDDNFWRLYSACRLRFILHWNSSLRNQMFT